MQTTEAVVRVQALDGGWEVTGRDRYPAVDPESIVISHNEWGPDTCSFMLRRRPGDIHPDLGAYTPVEIEIGGVVVWTGEVKETPSSDGDDAQITVTGRGWQYSLDDDSYERNYVHARLGDFRDIREHPGLSPVSYQPSFNLVLDTGLITMSFGNGQPLTANTSRVGAFLDFGQETQIARVIIDYEYSANTTTVQLIVSATDANFQNPTNIGTVTFTAGGGTVSGTLRATVSPAQQILSFYLISTATNTPNADIWMRVKGVRIFYKTAYESSDQSVLKASDVIADAIDTAAPVLTRKGVQATSFSIPDFPMNGSRTPREVIQAANAYHDYLAMVSVDKDLIFKAKPSAPVLEVGTWSGAHFEDASANSGEDIYNKVVVEGTGADGQPLRLVRYSSQLTGTVREVASQTLPNPSFDVDAANWTVTNPGTIVRDTGTFDTSPASGKFTPGWSGISYVESTFTGTFKQGTVYTLEFMAKGTGAADYDDVFFGALGTGDEVHKTIISNTVWTLYTVTWIPRQDRTGVKLKLSYYGVPSVPSLWFDSIKLYATRATLLDRRGRVRAKILPVQSALTTTAAQQVGDIFLQGHDTTPLRGELQVYGSDGVRKVLTGEGVAPHEMGLYVGELIRLSHRVDPDTGGLGRDGRIAAVTYRHGEMAAGVTLDNQRKNFEAFLERLAVVTAAKGVS